MGGVALGQACPPAVPEKSRFFAEKYRLQSNFVVIGSRARFSAEDSRNFTLRDMSQHPSLKTGGGTTTKRTVLKRFERVELLRKRGEFKEGGRITGLKKTKPEE